MAEILNIEYHTRRLMLKALNQQPTKRAAYKALGLSERTFFNLVDHFKIEKGKDGKYTSGTAVEYKVIKCKVAK